MFSWIVHHSTYLALLLISYLNPSGVAPGVMECSDLLSIVQNNGQWFIVQNNGVAVTNLTTQTFPFKQTGAALISVFDYTLDQLININL